MENSDSEYEIEETVVLVELNGIIDTDLLLQEQAVTKFLGIDTDEPLLQIGNCLFKGEYEDTLGTVVFYEPVDGSNTDGSNNEIDYKFLCKTDTKLSMKRCFPQERSMDNLKSAEAPVAMQNDEPKKSVTPSEIKNENKKKISKKKKLIKPIHQTILKSKENEKHGKKTSVESQNKETALKSDTSEQLIENIVESIDDNSISRIDTVPLNALNLENVVEKDDQSKLAHSENIGSQSNKKKTEDSKKGRKRNCDETIDSDSNIKPFISQRKLMKMEDEIQVIDQEVIAFVKEDTELNIANSIKNDIVLNKTENFGSDANIIDEPMFEREIVIDAVVNDKCEMQEKGTAASAPEMNEEGMIEKSIAQTLKKVMSNTSETSDPVSFMDKKERFLIEKENLLVSAEPENTINNEKIINKINNENGIQNKSSLANVSEVNKEPINEEKIISETVETNKSEIQEKCTLVDASEMSNIDTVIEERITQRMENLVGNTANVNQQKNVPASVLEVNIDEKLRIEEENIEVPNNTINNDKNVFHKGSTQIIISDDMSGSLSGKPIKASLVLKHCGFKDNTDCSSSSDIEHTKNESSSDQASVCKSPNDVNLYPRTEISEKIDDNDALSSCQENNKILLMEKIELEAGNIKETESIIVCDNLVELNSLKKDICVVSQSINDRDGAKRKLDEIEGNDRPVSSADKLVINTTDNSNLVTASDMTTVLMTGETSGLNAGTHLSCEVTQSTNSEGEYFENKDLVVEYEIFSESQQEENLEKNANIKIDDEVQIAEVEYSEPILYSDSFASEISQSCQESKFTEEKSNVASKTDVEICSQSTDQSGTLREVQIEEKDLCVSSCDFDDKSEYKENIVKDVHFNSVENAEHSNHEESKTNLVCEVSQSDESESYIPILTELSENNILSNECDASISNTEENQNCTISNQHISEITGSLEETANVPSTSIIHEITQSSSSRNVKHSDFPTEIIALSESNENVTIHVSTEFPEDELINDCVSSVDVSVVPETVFKIDTNSDEKDPNCEVSQSFRPPENQQFDETHKASNSKFLKRLRIEDTSLEFKHPCEVSQSVELESSTSLYNQSNVDGGDRAEQSSDNSVEYPGEICESSDDASNIGPNSYIDGVQPAMYSMCEVSQSFRSEETLLTTRHLTDPEMESSNECEVYAICVEPEEEAIKLNTSDKNICESSDDVNEFESEIVIDQLNKKEKNTCESSDDVNETESEIIIDEISVTHNICESSDDVNEIQSEIIIDHISNVDNNICESSDDINETEYEILIDQISNRERNICESSDDINEKESEIIIDQFIEGEKIICESSDDINETESEVIIVQLSDREKTICESSDDISKNFESIQSYGPMYRESDVSDEACHSSKFNENILSAGVRKVLTSEESFTDCETSIGISNIKNSTICESSEDTTSVEPNNQESIPDACTSSDKSDMESSDVAANLHDSKFFSSAETVGEMENNIISQSSNVACDFMDTSVNETENNIISQSENSPNISIYKTLNEPDNNQISQSGGYLEDISIIETESEISQSGGITDCSNAVTLNEIENNQISQSGCVLNSLNNIAVEETENDQISQSENTVGHLSDIFVTEIENNQISQSSNNEKASSEIALSEAENCQISQSGTVANCSVDISIAETENSFISQSGSLPIYSSNVSRTENDNSQISQSGNSKEFLYDISINESDNNQISQSSSSLNLSSNVTSRDMGNYQISQSGHSQYIETENNQISQSSSCRGNLIKESENYQISQSSTISGPQNILSNENNQISQSECNDNGYQQNQTLPLESHFECEVVNVSSSSDIVSSNFIDVNNSSYCVSNSAISSNSEVTHSLTSVQPHIWDRHSLVTSVTTSEMRTSVLSSEQTNETECQAAQTSAHLAVSSCSVTIEEKIENVSSVDQAMSSSNNINEIVESSLSVNCEEVIRHISKDDSPISESVIEEMPSTSQNLDQMLNRDTSSNNTNLRGEDFQSRVSGNSRLQKQFEFDSSLLQTSFLPSVSSQSDIENNSSHTRPSFLEVMASSASDFRNSLLSDNSFGKDKSHTSPVPESSGSNTGSCGEFSESFIREADGLVRKRSNVDESHAPENLSPLIDNSDPASSEVSRSSGIKRKYSDSGEFGYNHQQVSQSSDVVNSLSSSSRTHALISDNISQSSQQDFVQSSSNILKTPVLVSNDSVSLIDQVSSADENTSFIKRDSENADILESSIGVEAALPSCSHSTISFANSNQLIESSSDKHSLTQDAFDFKPENTESEVSSTPSETQYTGIRESTEGNDQFSSIQGNVIILPGTSSIIDEPDVEITTVEVTSPDSDYVSVRSDINSEAVLILDSSNEAETLNHSAIPSPLTVQLASFDQTVLSVDRSHSRIAAIGEVEAVNYDETSEVSESLVTNQNDISQSSLDDNNVSCSVSEFPTSHRVITTNYSFPDISQEAESKSSDDCISSYHSTCGNILPVPNLQSSSDREFYSHVGEFDDSVQSSLDETHMAINEQIKAISSPPNSSDSASCEEQRSLSINPFVTFSSQSHVFSTSYGASSSKITLCSNSSSEIGLDRDSLIEDSPQLITTTSNNDIIISSFDPELTNMSQSPQNSGNVCSPDQYVELSEQIVPAVQIAGADYVESSNDQLDDSESVNSVSQNDILNTDSES